VFAREREGEGSRERAFLGERVFERWMSVGEFALDPVRAFCSSSRRKGRVEMVPDRVREWLD
jgi:hypothetical protein